MKTPLNARSLRQHLTYSWWQYALVIALAAFGLSLYFSTQTYRSPESKKIDLYVYGYADDGALTRYMASVRDDSMQDMEEMNAITMVPDAAYGAMQLSTYMAAGEGDLYLLPRDEFISYAAEGSFLPLEGDQELMDLFTKADVSLQSGWRRERDSSENHLYGIPLDKLPGLGRSVSLENGYLTVFINNRNEDNVMKFLRILCADMLKAQ